MTEPAEDRRRAAMDEQAAAGAPAHAPDSGPRVSAWVYIAPALVLALAVLVFFRPILSGPNDVPGDLGDSRFNIYVLEHVYRWMIGAEKSLLSLPIFYPYPLTLGFSDTHFGSEIFYALFRVLGFDEYDAFKGWYIVGNVLTFFAAYYVLWLYVKSPWLAAIGAFAFAFSLSSVVQEGHAQLTYRMAVPFAFLFAARYAERKLPTYFYGLVAAVSFEILINIYLGLFTLLIAAVIFVVDLVLREPRSNLKPAALGRVFLAPLRERRNHRPLVITISAILFLAALAMLIFYARVSQLYGFIRYWDEIQLMVPRPWSYFIMDGLPYWSHISQALPEVPYRNEHQLFLGIPLTALFLFTVVYVAAHPRSASTDLKVQALVVVALLALMTMFGSFSLYWFISHIPGFNALRAVSRYQIVAAFPIVMAITLFLAQGQILGRLRVVAPIVLLAWMAYDIAVQHRALFSSQQSRDHMKALLAKIDTSKIDKDSILAFAGDPAVPFYINQIDAMFLSQALGIPTLNGYSGNFPPGYQNEPSCQSFVQQLKTYDSWAQEHGHPALAKLDYQPLRSGLTDCDLSQANLTKISFTNGPAPDSEAAKHLSLSNPRITRDGDALKVTVALHNGSNETFHAVGANPLRLSWRMSDTSDPKAGPGWDTRVDIGADLPPGSTRDVTFSVKIPNPQLQVTFVEELRFWAHDIGVMPLDIPLDVAPPQARAQ
jgi:hypothetical protein